MHFVLAETTFAALGYMTYMSSIDALQHLFKRSMFETSKKDSAVGRVEHSAVCIRSLRVALVLSCRDEEENLLFCILPLPRIEVSGAEIHSKRC